MTTFNSFLFLWERNLIVICRRGAAHAQPAQPAQPAQLAPIPMLHKTTTMSHKNNSFPQLKHCLKPALHSVVLVSYQCLGI